MKTSRLKLITTIIAAVLTAGAILVVCYRDRVGTVTNPRYLPRFGPALPSLETGPLEYEYNPRIERVLARGHASTNAFSTICAQLKLETLHYEEDFPRARILGESTKFAPAGPRIWSGSGHLYPSGRTVVRIYFEPPPQNATNSEGTLYIQIL